MAPNKSDLQGSWHLDEAVDPKLGVWGTLKESARIAVEHRTILVVLLLVLLPLAAFTTSNHMRIGTALHRESMAVQARKQLCFEKVYGPAAAANRAATSMPGYERYCRLLLRPTTAEALAMMRKHYGGSGNLLELAATLFLASVAHAAMIRAVVEAYDVEEESYGGVAEWLKLRFNRKLMQAGMRALGTRIFAAFVVYGAVVFLLAMTYLVAVLVTPWQAAVVVCSLILAASTAGLVYLATTFFLADTVSVVEAGTWGLRALSRSSKLISGHRWKSVAFMLPYALLFMPSTVFLIVTVARGLLKPSIGIAACVMGLKILVAYFSAIVPTVFYLKCRAYCSAVKKDVELGSPGYRLVEKGDSKQEPDTSLSSNLRDSIADHPRMPDTT